MSKSKRQPASAKPITANPLFPAVVALWFGAAFGLGSLAVRPSLLEDLVLQSHIDLVIPAAAPPLGLTARILVALLLAAVGAMIGIVLARRLTRTKVEPRERKRGAADLAVETPRVRARDSHPDAPARAPLSIADEFGDDAFAEQDRVAPAPGLLPNRRRSLALKEEEAVYVPAESAPLPGLGEAGPLDLAALDLSEPATETHGDAFVPAATSAPTLDWNAAAPVEPRPQFAAPIGAAMVEAAIEDGRQVFGIAPQPAAEPAPRQIFGVETVGDRVPQDFVKDAGFQTTVFDVPEAAPLFARPAAAQLDATVEAEAATPPVTVSTPETVPLAQVSVFAEPVAIPEAAPPVEPAAAAEPAPAAPAPQAPLPSPAGLGMTDLAERLAESMRRRRERMSAVPAAVAAPVAAAVEPTAAEAPTPFAMPAAFVPVAAEEPVAERADVSLLASENDASPPPPAVVGLFGPVPAPVQQPAPVAGEPQPFSALPRLGAAEPAQEAAPPAPAAVPAAMRPLALDAFLEEDDGGFDPSLLPPRHIAMPAAPQPQASAAAALPDFAAPASPAEPATAEPDPAMADDADDNPYASLLGLVTPRAAPVRIEEPEPAEDAAIEPVVIFPGQAAPLAPLVPVAAVAAVAAPAHEDAGFRRFDAPATAGQGQPVDAASSAALIGGDEAAQALRSALSNLQRMSGAA